MKNDIFILTKTEVETLCGKKIEGQFPHQVYCRGNPKLLSLPKVAIVGSRHPTLYGRETSYRFASVLASHGFLVISGGAIGVDSVVNKTALAHGSTCSVIGSGLRKPYPSSNYSFFQELGSSQNGLMISEFEPDTPAFKWNFPTRNITMAKLADFVLVIEAAARSGSLITAQVAIDLGTDVGALPGPVDSPNSAGTNALIQNGAFCITSPEDVCFRIGARSLFAHC